MKLTSTTGKVKILMMLSCVTLLTACHQSSPSKTEKSATKTQTNKKTTTSEKSNTATSSESSTSSGSTSSETQPSSTVGQTPQVIAVEAIKAGDYSSLVGTRQNGKGQTLSFDASGITAPQDNRVDVSRATIENGILRASIAYGNYGAVIEFAPSRVTFPTGSDGLGDGSDTSRDRIVIGHQPIYSDGSSFYYRVGSSTGVETGVKHKSQTVEEATSRRDTGVWLSGGQSSVDYANQILGYKEREVSAGNYGMTDGIPYNAVISKDGQVWVYQNGVIISEDHQIMYEP